MKIAVVTGGGDCPGLNAVIRAVVRRGEQHGLEVMGIREGWRGLLDPPMHFRLTREATSGTLHLGGTILGTSRTNPFKKPANGPDIVMRNLKSLNVGAVVAIGGEDTLGVATKLSAMGVKVVGVPKTIDNDLSGTDLTFGFDTAVQIATEAIDRLHSTAEAHKRVIVCEVMGRHAGWIAVHSGMAGGADVILIPERPVDIEEVCRLIRRRHSRGRYFSIVVVAEGAVPAAGEVVGFGEDEFGHARLGGIGALLEREIEERTGFETRTTVLGHIQRGGTPTAFDRVLATRFGSTAIDAASDGRWGMMVSLSGTRVELMPLEDAVRELRTVPVEEYEAAAASFG